MRVGHLPSRRQRRDLTLSMISLMPSCVILPSPSGDGLPRSLPDAPGWALFLDLDGTLCSFRDDPATVALDDTQHELLRVLSLRLEGALCVLSGRAEADLARALGGLPLAHRGGHGRDEGEALGDAVAAELGAAARVLRQLAGERRGAWLEQKPMGCALHYRNAPQFAESLIVAVRLAADQWPHLRLLEGQRVLELIPARASKGAALREAMQQAPFHGRIPVAIGDDVTDEDAFVAAAALGGFGVAIGPRASAAARHRLTDPAALDAWLRGLAFATPERVDA